MERVSQQPIGMQFHQPLALLYVTLPARYIFGVLCVHHHHSDPQLGENIVGLRSSTPRWLAAPLCQSGTGATTSPCASDRPSNSQIPAPDGGPDLRARPRSGSHCLRRSPRHWGLRWTVQDRWKPTSAPTLSAVAVES